MFHTFVMRSSIDTILIKRSGRNIKRIVLKEQLHLVDTEELTS